MNDRIAILTPVLDDWESFAILVHRIADAFAGSGVGIGVIAVDDGSLTPFDPGTVALPAGSAVTDVSVLRLAANFGHQRAIAVGLAALAKRGDIDSVVVMDSDGEDRPEDIVALRAAAAANPGHAILARRSKRSETGLFRIGYRVYKSVFRVLTGQTIDFGNFCWLPMPVVRRLVYMPDLWNNLPAALMRSRLRLTFVPLARGVRYAGQSKMNLPALVVHGLSAMSVHTDIIFVRVIILAGMVSALTLFGMAGVVAIRLFTDLAVPGWASAVFGSLIVILMQTLVMVIATALVLLAGRSARPIVPAVDAVVFILRSDETST